MKPRTYPTGTFSARDRGRRIWRFQSTCDTACIGHRRQSTKEECSSRSLGRAWCEEKATGRERSLYCAKIYPDRELPHCNNGGPNPTANSQNGKSREHSLGSGHTDNHNPWDHCCIKSVTYPSYVPVLEKNGGYTEPNKIFMQPRDQR